ncbi:MAG: hypothetical protein ACTHLO_14655 [Pseudolabrys sp.]
MPDTLNAAEMRRLAMQCAARAEERDISADERARLMRMREGLLEVAACADWLAGRHDPAAA